MVVLSEAHHGDPHVHARILHGTAGQSVFLSGVLIMTDNSPQTPQAPEALTATMRITAIVRVLTGLMVMALIVNIILNVSSTLWPNWIPEKMSGAGFQKDITQRVHAAEKAFTSNAQLQNQKLCVFLGLSSQRESVDLATLTDIDGIDAKYLGLCGAGLSMATMTQQSSALFDSNLNPQLAIIGINLYHQVDPLVIAKLKQADAPVVTKTGLPIITPLLKGDIRKTWHQTRQRIWVYQRRRDVNTVLTENLAAINTQMLNLFGTSSSSGSDEVTSPWREMIRIDGPEKASKATYKAQTQSYANRGLFDVASYEPQLITQEEKALNDIIRELQQRGSTVVIMLMPEYSSLRESVPAVAMQRLAENLQTTFGDTAPEVIDMRDALGDDKFTDISHVNSSGRMAYSKLIAPMLVKWMQ